MENIGVLHHTEIPRLNHESECQVKTTQKKSPITLLPRTNLHHFGRTRGGHPATRTRDQGRPGQGRTKDDQGPGIPIKVPK